MTWQGARKGVQINSKGRDSPDEQQAITPGKLADESKLGGLNQLMYTSFSIAKPYSIPLKKRFREGWTENENSTSQTTPKEVIQDEPQNGKTEICENNNNINMRDKSRKRSKRTLQEDLDERTCKGKRYMEFTGPKQNGPNLNKNKTPPKKKLSKVQILKMNLSSKYFNTSPLKKEPNKTAKDKISQDHNLNLLADLAETALQKNKADD